MAKPTRSGLGRGLNSLLSGSYEEAIPAPPPERTRVEMESHEELEQKPVQQEQKPVKQDPKPATQPISAEEKARIAAMAPTRSENNSEGEHVGEDNVTIKSVSARTPDEVPLRSIIPNPDQPRTNFKREELEELAASIEKDGLLQPILVRTIGENSYQIIAGERRWQACKLIGMEKVPVRIKNADADQALELALVENIQRSDLNPIEEAYGYRRLMERQNLTQAELAQMLSKGRSTITNALRLLDLPEDAQQLLFEEKITAGHARAILSVPTAEGRQKLTEKLLAEKLSVRETEAIARLLSANAQPKSSKPRSAAPQSYKIVARSLREYLGTNVKVKSSQGKNKIEIEFKDEEDLERIFKELTEKEDAAE